MSLMRMSEKGTPIYLVSHAGDFIGVLTMPDIIVLLELHQHSASMKATYIGSASPVTSISQVTQ